MAMIVLDGQNNVGKSTMVDWTVARHGIPSYHHAEPGTEAAFVRENLARWGRSDDVAIFDRFFFTYLAYPSTGNWGWGKSLPPSVTPDFVAWAKGELAALINEGNLLLIHAAIPIEKLWAYEIGLNPAVESAKQDFVVLGRAFDEALAGWGALAYDYTSPASVEAVREAISRFIVGVRQREKVTA